MQVIEWSYFTNLLKTIEYYTMKKIVFSKQNVEWNMNIQFCVQTNEPEILWIM